MSKNFYCAKKSGDPNFSIEEWNEAYKFCNDAGLSEAQSNKILFPELDKPCETMCDACANIVLETQAKNKKFREELERKIGHSL